MELKVWQQRMLFGIVVAGLAVLGIYLVSPNFHHSGDTGAAASPSASPTPAAVASSIADTPVAQSSPGTATPSSVNIYSWLPFPQAELADAAGVVTSFCSDYETYRYTDSAA